MRNGSDRDANVTSIQFRIGEKKKTYAVEGYADMSSIFLTGFTAPTTGFRYSISGGKVSGKYIALARYRVVTDKFDPNDMGYLDRNNVVSYGLTQKYNILKPFGHFLSITNSLDLDLGNIFIPRHYTFFTITGQHNFTFRHGFILGLNWLTNPIVSYDYFETRVIGRYLIYPKNYRLGLSVATDYRKRFAVDAAIQYRIFLERNRTIFYYTVAPRWRVNDRLNILYSFSQELKHDNVGFVAYRNDSLFFGLRDLNTITNTLTLNYAFTSRMGLSVRVRHYWSQVDYRHYFLINENGKVEEGYYNRNADVSFNAFNIDAVFTWQFLPGSELSVVWKNAILTTDNIMRENYFDDVRYVFDSPQINSLSLKLIWYIDAGNMLNKKHNKTNRDK
jgi:hypothetical protein